MTENIPNPKRRFPRIRLALTLVLVLVVGALLLYLQSGAFHERVRRRVIAQLEYVTGGKAELKNFHWSLALLQFDLDDFTIHGLEKPGETPYAHIDHAHIAIKVISLLGQEIGLREVDVQHPVIHLIVYPDGTTNQPYPKIQQNPGDAAERLFDLRMDRLRISQGLLLLNETKVPLDVRADEVTAGMRFAGKPQPNYAGRVQIGRLEFRGKESPEVLSQAETDFTIQKNQLLVSSLHWSSGKSQVDGSGTISDFHNPRIEATYRGSIDLTEVSRVLGQRELRDGMVRVDGKLRYISSEDFFSSGVLSVKNGAYASPGLRVAGVEATAVYTVDVDRINLTKLSGHALGGSFAGSAAIVHWSRVVPKIGISAGKHEVVASKQPEGLVQLVVSGIGLSQSMQTLLPPKNPLQQLRIASLLDGNIRVHWVGSSTNADAAVDLNASAPSSASSSDLPITGVIKATYYERDDRIDVAALNLAARNTRLGATGAIGIRSQLRISLNTSDLSELLPVMRALGSEEGPLPAIVHGQASFNGLLTGKLASPTLAGRLQATDFDTVLPAHLIILGSQPQNASSSGVSKTHNVRWDSLVADVAYSPTSASAHNVILKRGKAAITGSEDAGLVNGQLEPESTVQIHIALRDTNFAELQEILGSALPLTGTFNGQALLSGTKVNLDATGHVQLSNGAFYGEPYRSLASDFEFRGTQVELRNVVVQENGGRISGDGRYDFNSEALAFNVTGSNFDLAHLATLQTGKLGIGGHAEFTASGSGTVTQPIVNAKFSIAGLTLGGESAGDLVATAVTHGSELHLEAQTSTKLASATVNGDVELRDGFPAEIHLDVAKLDFDPLLRVYLPGQLTGHSSVSGKFVLRGPLRQPRDISVVADVDQFSADIQNIKLRNEGPLQFSISNQVASIQQLHIVGSDTDITGTGKVELAGAGRVDLHGNGHVNLGLIQTLNPGVTSSGQMTFTVNASGKLDDPIFVGNVQIANGAFALTDLPNGLSAINGTLSFDKNRLRVQTLKAKTGGGDLALGGYITYSNGVFFDLTATGRDIRVRYPEGVSSQATADLRLLGSIQNSVLSGDVTITKFGLTPQFDLAAYVQRAKQPSTPPAPNSIIDNVRIDIHIVSTPELRVETSLARVSGDVDLRLRGTVARPSVLGRVSIAEGDITFNSTTYHLERGDIVFANPVRIEPVVNVEASARVRDYDITLGFHGTPDKLNVTYRSEPPLPSADIIALLAFGRTRQESEIQAEQGSQAATAQSFAQTASNAILGEALNSAVSSRVQKLFGVSRIKIDPNLGGTEDNPNARLTVEQQISKNVTVTYLTNLGQYAQQVLQVEYNINKSVSVVAVRDYTGVLAIDLRIRQRKR